VTARAEVLGRRGERRDDHHRVVGGNLQAELLVELGAAAEVRVEPDHVGEEGGVEAARLQPLGEVDPKVELVVAELVHLGVAPEAVDDVGRGVHHERAEVEWLVVHRGGAPVGGGGGTSRVKGELGG